MDGQAELALIAGWVPSCGCCCCYCYCYCYYCKRMRLECREFRKLREKL